MGGSVLRIYYAFIEEAADECSSPLACGSLILIVHGCKKPVPQGTGFFRFRHRPSLFPIPASPLSAICRGILPPGLKRGTAGGHPGRATWSAAASGGCRKA